jgi:molybdopterin synthase catalytic subunit
MKKWGVGRVVILHRIGPVPVGEVSVAIAVAAPHRAEAFEACRWLIDTLKTDVPIWKKDVFADGCTRWVDPGTQGSCSSEVT